MNRGQILDILGSQNHFNVIDSLLKLSCAYFKEHDIDYVSCRMSEKNPYKKIVIIEKVIIEAVKI